MIESCAYDLPAAETILLRGCSAALPVVLLAALDLTPTEATSAS